MDITLTTAELSMFTAAVEGEETVEQAFHRLLTPMLKKYAETRLQGLADAYRQLSPDLQDEAIQVLTAWQLSKLPQE
jgi:hypothetical protein